MLLSRALLKENYESCFLIISLVCNYYSLYLFLKKGYFPKRGIYKFYLCYFSILFHIIRLHITSSYNAMMHGF